MKPALQSAGRLVWWVIALEWLGTLSCMLLAFLWLQIPDSHAWQFIFSMVSAVLLAVAFCWIQVTVFRNLRRPAHLAPIWERLLVFFLLACLWIFLLSLIGIGRSHAPLYAGYWNSRLSPDLRYLATYRRLVQWQQHLWSLVQWLLAALLLPVAVEGATTGVGAAAWKRISGVYRQVRYWLAAVVCGFLGSLMVGALVAWKPGSGVAQEIASTLIRLGIAYSGVILLWSFIVSLAAGYLQEKAAIADSGANS